MRIKKSKVIKGWFGLFNEGGKEVSTFKNLDIAQDIVNELQEDIENLKGNQKISSLFRWEGFITKIKTNPERMFWS